MGIGDFLQSAGGQLKNAAGQGLGMAQQLAEGLGLARPQQQPGMFGAPAQYQPTDLSDMNLLQQLSLRFQNAVESSEGNGTAVASNQLRDRRATANKQRTEAFQQGIKLMDDFRGVLDKAGPAEQERMGGLFKKRFGELAGGQPGEADEFYDTFMGGRASDRAGLLKLAQQDPALAQLIEGGGSMADIKAAVQAQIAKGTVFDDPANLKIDRDALGSFMRDGGGDPKLYAQLQGARLEGGDHDLDSVLSILGDRLTEPQRDRLKRHEADLQGQGFVLDPELAARRKAKYEAGLKPKTSGNRMLSGPGDADFLVQVADNIEAGDYTMPEVSEDVSGPAIDKAMIRIGQARRDNAADEHRKRLRGPALEKIRGNATIIVRAENIGKKLPGWKTGFASNRADLLAWYVGRNDPEKAAIRTELGLNLADLIKEKSGTAASDTERQFLTQITPNIEDSIDALSAKLESFTNYYANDLSVTRAVYERLGDYEGLGDELSGMLGSLGVSPDRVGTVMGQPPRAPQQSGAAPAPATSRSDVQARAAEELRRRRAAAAQ